MWVYVRSWPAARGCNSRPLRPYTVMTAAAAGMRRARAQDRASELACGKTAVRTRVWRTRGGADAGWRGGGYGRLHRGYMCDAGGGCASPHDTASRLREAGMAAHIHFEDNEPEEEDDPQHDEDNEYDDEDDEEGEDDDAEEELSQVPWLPPGADRAGLHKPVALFPSEFEEHFVVAKRLADKSADLIQAVSCAMWAVITPPSPDSCETNDRGITGK
eukprot:scaffold1106_cov608-Prasinococcus_capsulatus_cf.AAC.22